MKTILLAAFMLVAAVPALAGTTSAACAETSNEDICAVQRLEGRVAMILVEQGFDAYAAQFHKDYSNWADGGEAFSRERFLAGVKSWYQRGNRAVAVKMAPVSTEIFGDFALSRYRLREDFSDGTSFVGHFTSLAAKQDGRWLLFRTSFTTLYRGKTSGAPSH